MHAKEVLLLVLLLSPPGEAREPAILGTWQSRPAAAVSAGRGEKLRLTFGSERCRVQHRVVDASYRCSIRPAGRDAFVVDRFDPERNRLVRRVFHVEGDRMWSLSGGNGTTEEFRRVRAH